MKKIKETLKGLAQSAIKPLLTATGAIGGHQLGILAAGYAPRIANQLPFVGMGIGAIGGAYAGSRVDSRISGISVSLDTVKVSRDETKVQVKGATYAAGDIAAVMATFEEPEVTTPEPATPEEIAVAGKKAGAKKEEQATA